MVSNGLSKSGHGARIILLAEKKVFDNLPYYQSQLDRQPGEVDESIEIVLCADHLWNGFLFGMCRHDVKSRKKPKIIL